MAITLLAIGVGQVIAAAWAPVLNWLYVTGAISTLAGIGTFARWLREGPWENRHSTKRLLRGLEVGTGLAVLGLVVAGGLLYFGVW